MIRMGRPRTSHKDMPPGLRLVSGRWYWRPTDEAGRRVCEALSPGKKSIPVGETKADARKWWVSTVLPRLDALEPDTDAIGTLSEIIDDYLLSKKFLGLASATQKNYRADLVKLKALYGTVRYAKSESEASEGGFFRRMNVARHLDDAERKVSANRQISALSAVFSYAQRTGKTEYNPCRGVERNPERARDRLISWQDYARLRRAATPMVRVAMLLARLTALRESDLLALSWSHVGNDYITYRHQKTNFHLKIRITKTLGKVLAAAKKLRGNLKGMTVICTERGQRYTPDGFRSNWRKVMLKSGVEDVHFHDLKAKAVNDSEDRGRDASNLAGHTDRRTTQRVYRRGGVKVMPAK